MSLEIVKINKYNTSDWSPELLFSEFNVRAFLKETKDLVTRLEFKRQLKRRLIREVGEEGKEWNLYSNRISNKDELYLKNTGRLMLWKLQNMERFNGLFESVEQHER